jgi:catechol 2,3-dioxygenase-like lactoylglutathione lyase family enzyme
MPTVFRVTLPVPDLYAAVHFYSTLFGLDGEELVPGMHAFRFTGATLVLLESGVAAHGEPIGPSPSTW